MCDEAGKFSWSDLGVCQDLLIMADPSLLGQPDEMKGKMVTQLQVRKPFGPPAYCFVNRIEGSQDEYVRGGTFFATTHFSEHRSALLVLHPLSWDQHVKLESGQKVKLDSSF